MQQPPSPYTPQPPPQPHHGGQPQMFPGQQILQDPMASMAMQYGSQFVPAGKEFVEKKVRYSLQYSSCVAKSMGKKWSGKFNSPTKSDKNSNENLLFYFIAVVELSSKLCLYRECFIRSKVLFRTKAKGVCRLLLWKVRFYLDFTWKRVLWIQT